MKKVYQKIVKQGDGDCMRAVIASLFELPLGKVPHFLRESNRKNKNANFLMWQWLKKHGYDYCVINPCKFINMKQRRLSKLEMANVIKCLKYDNGINGYFYATVPSQTFKDGTHAVVVDAELNIVHDPNPNQLSLKLTKHDIIDVVTNKGNWHFGNNRELVITQ